MSQIELNFLMTTNRCVEAIEPGINFVQKDFAYETSRESRYLYTNADCFVFFTPFDNHLI